LTEKQAIYCELLVLRCQRGQKDALEELVRNWEKRLFYYVRRQIREVNERNLLFLPVFGDGQSEVLEDLFHILP